MVAGLLAGALLGALDLLAMLQMARKAATLGASRATAVMRWGALGRMACVFLALVLGAMALGRPSFLCMAATYVVARIAGLFVVAARTSGSFGGSGGSGTSTRPGTSGCYRI